MILNFNFFTCPERQFGVNYLLLSTVVGQIHGGSILKRKSFMLYIQINFIGTSVKAEGGLCEVMMKFIGSSLEFGR